MLLLVESLNSLIYKTLNFLLCIIKSLYWYIKIPSKILSSFFFKVLQSITHIITSFKNLISLLYFFLYHITHFSSHMLYIILFMLDLFDSCLKVK